MKEFNYKINGTPYRVVVTKSDSELLELEVNGTPFTVEMVQKAKKSLSGVKRPSASTSSPVPQSTSTPLVTRPATPTGKTSSNRPSQALFWISGAKWVIQ